MHCDGGIHYVWPCNLGKGVAVVVAFAIAPHIPHKKKKPAEQHRKVLARNLRKFTAGILRVQNKASKQHP